MELRQASMPSSYEVSTAIHVVATGDRWLVSRGQLPFEAYGTKRDAVVAGRALARRFSRPVIVHDELEQREVT